MKSFQYIFFPLLLPFKELRLSVCVCDEVVHVPIISTSMRWIHGPHFTSVLKFARRKVKNINIFSTLFVESLSQTTVAHTCLPKSPSYQEVQPPMS